MCNCVRPLCLLDRLLDGRDGMTCRGWWQDNKKMLNGEEPTSIWRFAKWQRRALFSACPFKLRVHESDGQAFQDLFVKVMQHANQIFDPCRTDERVIKNDGFDKANGLYYQVYAPEDLAPNVYTAVSKLTDSFSGLKIIGIHKYHPSKSISLF